MAKLGKILLLGGSGQLGSEFVRLLASDNDILSPERAQLDLSKLTELPARLDALAPDIIINAVAFTHVDMAEKEKKTALCLNAEMPKTVALWCKVNDSRLLHFSSDYTLGGKGKAPQGEDSDLAPLNWYGSTKAAGDQAIFESHCSALILRTSWVYSAHHKNFMLSIIKQAFTSGTLSVVDDQIGTPTPADWLAKIGILCLNRPWCLTPRLLNAVPSGFVSWCGFAEAIIAELKKQKVQIKADKVRPLLSNKLIQLAKRPKNSRLDNTALINYLGLRIPHWHELMPGLVAHALKSNNL